MVIIVCSDNIAFIEKSCDFTTKFCENIADSDFAKYSLEKIYDKGIVPKNHPYKHYQILDLYDEPALEFICAKITIIHKDI